MATLNSDRRMAPHRRKVQLWYVHLSRPDLLNFGTPIENSPRSPAPIAIAAGTPIHRRFDSDYVLDIEDQLRPLRIENSSIESTFPAEIGAGHDKHSRSTTVVLLMEL